MTMPTYLDPARRVLNYFARDHEPTAGDLGFALAEVKGVDQAKRQVSGILSTPSIDRYGEVVLPEAFKDSLPAFMTNPKFLAGHSYGGPDGSPSSIGHWIDMQVTSQALLGTAQFLPEGDDLADRWWFRFVHGAQRSFSVGFIVRAWEMRDVKGADGQKRRVRTFTDVELVEVSAVEIPANADALLRAASAMHGEAGNSGSDAISEAGGLSNRQWQTALRLLRPAIKKIIADETALLCDPDSAFCESVIDGLARRLGRPAERTGTGCHVWDLSDEQIERYGTIHDLQYEDDIDLSPCQDKALSADYEDLQAQLRGLDASELEAELQATIAALSPRADG